MSWDDEDFEVPTSTKDIVVESWEEEEEATDEPLLESWDVDPDEEAAKKKKAASDAAAKRAALEKARKDAAKKRKESKRAGSKKQTPLAIDTADEATRRKLLKEAQMRSDMANAEELFGALGVSEDHKGGADASEEEDEEADEMFGDDLKPKGTVLTLDTPLSSLPIFNPEDKQGFERLRKALSAEMERLSKQSLLLYTNSLAVDLVADSCEPLSIENSRKTVSTLNAQINRKVKEERKARLSKTGGTATGGAGKKKAKGKNLNLGGPSNDYDDMMGGGGDYGDDDFM